MRTPRRPTRPARAPTSGLVDRGDPGSRRTRRRVRRARGRSRSCARRSRGSRRGGSHPSGHRCQRARLPMPPRSRVPGSTDRGRRGSFPRTASRPAWSGERRCHSGPVAGRQSTAMASASATADGSGMSGRSTGPPPTMSCTRSRTSSTIGSIDVVHGCLDGIGRRRRSRPSAPVDDLVGVAGEVKGRAGCARGRVSGGEGEGRECDDNDAGPPSHEAPPPGVEALDGGT